MTDVQALLCSENESWQEQLIVVDYMQEEHARVFILVWAEVISELSDDGGERHGKQIVGLLPADNFGLKIQQFQHKILNN